MSAETLATYGPWAMVFASFVALGVLAAAIGVLYRELLASQRREAEITQRVLPLIKELLDFIDRRGRDSKWPFPKK